MSDLSFISSPRATPPVLERALLRAGSPASPHAARLYAIPVGYGLDPAVAWAFFAHESSCGTKGVARQTLNWGNLRRGQGRQIREADGWAWYSSWEASLHDWCTLITRYYITARGLDTVGKAIPVYAPSSDNNRPAAYVAAVLDLVRRWQTESRVLDPWGAWGTAYALPEEQRDFAIPQAWLADGGKLGVACSEEIAIPLGAARLFLYGAIVWYRESNSTKVLR